MTMDLRDQIQGFFEKTVVDHFLHQHILTYIKSLGLDNLTITSS
jgi:phosphoribosylpyrophosphate synthetase